jgi:flagellar protein FliO/FliZ
MIPIGIWTAAGSLIGVLALIGLATRMYQASFRRTLGQTGRTLVVRESIALDPKRRLHIVQCGERQVILLTGGGQDLVVGWMPDQ